MAGHGAHANNVAADIEVGDGDQEVRPIVVVHGDNSPGLEFEFRDANSIFDEENFLRATVEGFEAAVLLPVSGGVAEGFVFENFDGDVAEGLIGEIARDVGEGGGREVGFAVAELDGDGRFVFDGVDDFGVAEGDVDVVVAMPVHEGVGVGRNVDVEDADGFVFKCEVVMRLGGNFNFGGSRLDGEEREAEEEAAVHAGDCSTRARTARGYRAQALTTQGSMSVIAIFRHLRYLGGM